MGKDRSNNREGVFKTRDGEGDGGLEIICIKLAFYWPAHLGKPHTCEGSV